MKLHIAIIAATGLIVSACNSQQVNEGAMPEAAAAAGTEKPEPCADAENTIQMNACWANEEKLAEAQLEKYTQAAFAALRENPEDNTEQTIAMIKASGAAFETYAKMACDAVYNNWSGGSISNLMTHRCRIDLLNDRTHHIWREYSISMEDYTKLPEPERRGVHYKLDTEEAEPAAY